MLDKSLPYKSIIMRMEAAVAERLAPPAPAAGYRIRPFVPGDERHWA
ncbi:GNAT family N-acetyltransferase, partial [Escherichia coli]|nr:GNAT family N-acetyltransferase [Escherichia coli]